MFKTVQKDLDHKLAVMQIGPLYKPQIWQLFKISGIPLFKFTFSDPSKPQFLKKHFNNFTHTGQLARHEELTTN